MKVTTVNNQEKKLIHRALGVWLATLRRFFRVSQIELGRLLGLHQSAISRIEKGLQALSQDQLYTIAINFNPDLHWVFKIYLKAAIEGQGILSKRDLESLTREHLRNNKMAKLLKKYGCFVEIIDEKLHQCKAANDGGPEMFAGQVNWNLVKSISDENFLEEVNKALGTHFSNQEFRNRNK